MQRWKQQFNASQRLLLFFGLSLGIVFGTLGSHTFYTNYIAQAVAPSNIITYQGRVLNANGVPVASASAEIIFELYDDLAAGNCLWSNSSSTCASATARTVTLTDGLFSEPLGDTSQSYATIPDAVFANNAAVYLQVTIEGETLSPRQLMTAVPFAMNAQTLDGLNSDAFLLAGGDTATGAFDFTGATLSGASPFVFEGSTVDAFSTTFTITDPTAGNVITFQDGTGTVAFLSDIGGSSLFTDGGTVTYLTSVTDDFALGGTTLSAPFSVAAASNTIRIGDGANDANDPTIQFYASNAGPDSGTLSYIDADGWLFVGGDVYIGDASVEQNNIPVFPSMNGDELWVNGSILTGGSVSANEYVLAGLGIDSNGAIYVTGLVESLELLEETILGSGALAITADAGDLELISTLGDLFITSGGTVEFNDATLAAAITLTDADDSFDSGDTAIVDAINVAYNAALSGASLFTDGGTVTYLTSATDDFAIGGSAFATSAFGVDESANTIYVGDGATTNATINLKNLDAGVATITFNDSDRIVLTGGDVEVTSDLHVNGGDIITSQSVLNFRNDDGGAREFSFYSGADQLFRLEGAGTQGYGYIPGSLSVENLADENVLYVYGEATTNPVAIFESVVASADAIVSIQGGNFVNDSGLALEIIVDETTETADIVRITTEFGAPANNVFRIEADGETFSDVGFTAGAFSTNYYDALITSTSAFTYRSPTSFTWEDDASNTLLQLDDDGTDGSLYLPGTFYLENLQNQLAFEIYSEATSQKLLSISNDLTTFSGPMIDVQAGNFVDDDGLLLNMAAGTEVTATADLVRVSSGVHAGIEFRIEASGETFAIGGFTAGSAGTNYYDDTIRSTGAFTYRSPTSFTWQDEASNTLMTLTDNGTTGNLSFTGRLLAPTHANNQGLRLPTIAGVPVGVTGTSEGDIVWDSTGDALYVYDGAAFLEIAGGGGSLFTDGGTVTYLTSTTDDFAIGGSAFATAAFGVDESANTAYIGDGSGTDGTLVLKNASGDPGTIVFNSADNFEFTGGNGRIIATDFSCTNCLDFAEFEDTLDLDASLTLNQTTNTWTQSFTGTTGVGYTYNANSLTSGSALSVGTNSSLFTGSLINGTHNSTYSATTATSGELLNLERALTLDDGGAGTEALLINGSLVNISSNATLTSGSIILDSSNLLRLDQNFATSTGDVFAIQNGGLGAGIFVEQVNHLTATQPSTTAGGAIHVSNTQNNGMGFSVYTDNGATANAPLAYLFADNSAFDQSVMTIENDGTGYGFYLEQNGPNIGMVLLNSAGASALAPTAYIYGGVDTAFNRPHLQIDHRGYQSNSYGQRIFNFSTGVDADFEATGLNIAMEPSITANSPRSYFGTNLSLTREIANAGTSSLAIASPIMAILDSAHNPGVGTITNTGDLLRIWQLNSNASGALIDLLHSGSGEAIKVSAGVNTTTQVLDLNTSGVQTADIIQVDGTGLTAGTGLFISTDASMGDTTGKGILLDYQASDNTVARHMFAVRTDIDTANRMAFIVEADGDTRIGQGALCIDNDGSCAGSVDGTIYYVASSVGNSDLAEVYPSPDTLVAGDVVMVSTTANNVQQTTGAYARGALAAIATNPATLMGSAKDTELLAAGIDPAGAPNWGNFHLLPGTYPVALSGRVPVKVTTENGSIQAGDPLTSSSTAGAAMKSTLPGNIVGYALESYSGAGVGVISVFIQPSWHSGFSIAQDGDAIEMNKDVFVSATGVANDSMQGMASNGFALRGSGWNGVGAENVEMVLLNDVTDAGDYQLVVRNNDGNDALRVSQAGDLALAGRLYPSDRGTLQTDKYIFYDGSVGPGGDFMRTNASGWATGSYDFAEMFPSQDDLKPGEVVIFADNKEEVKRSTGVVYDARIAGIVSTRPGFLAGENRPGDSPIALAGRVPTFVTNENGAIQPGDPLTTSSTPGFAMKATKAGPIIGYAMESFNGASGSIIVFVRGSYYAGGPVTDAPAAVNNASGATNLSNLSFNGTLNMNGGAIINVGSVSHYSNNWRIEENGDFITRGRLRQIIKSHQGEDVETTAVLARESTIQLAGTVKMVNGSAIVNFEDIDPQFNDIIATDAPYRVFITANAPTNPIYVTNRTVNGFMIAESNGGLSTAEADFLVIAYHKDFAPVVEEEVQVVEDVEIVEVEPVAENVEETLDVEIVEVVEDVQSVESVENVEVVQDVEVVEEEPPVEEAEIIEVIETVEEITEE